LKTNPTTRLSGKANIANSAITTSTMGGREKDIFTLGFDEPLLSMITIACNNNNISTTSESNA
jgi:hypothetical protein